MPPKSKALKSKSNNKIYNAPLGGTIKGNRALTHFHVTGYSRYMKTKNAIRQKEYRDRQRLKKLLNDSEIILTHIKINIRLLKAALKEQK